LLDAASIERVARLLLELARSSPAEKTDVPSAPVEIPDQGGVPCQSVLDGFLAALRDRDALGAIACAHPDLFVQPREPTADGLLRSIEAGGGSPATWLVREVRTLTTRPGMTSWEIRPDIGEAGLGDAESVNAVLSATFDGGATREVAVHLGREGRGEWTVRGYAVGVTQVLGVAFPTPQD
jgi:hypothetical protein